jgi:hypothetical protein
MGTIFATNVETVESQGLANSIEERKSQELVFAFVGPVASGVSTAAGYLKDILEQRFTYKVCPIIKLSEFIKREAHRVSARLENEGPERVNDFAPLVVTSLLSRSVSVGS